MGPAGLSCAAAASMLAAHKVAVPAAADGDATCSHQWSGAVYCCGLDAVLPRANTCSPLLFASRNPPCCCCRARELMQSVEDGEPEDVAAAAQQGQQQVQQAAAVGHQQQQQEQQQQRLPNGLSAAGAEMEGAHLDADVESEHEGSQRGRSAAGGRGGRGPAAAAAPPDRAAMSDD